ncbi:lysylphosphatidylglycerol synthase transmembrane domain-containing protein [Pelagibius sp. CAU 1746]|uniref:lysylphosphatidylglycerol synthase transmembrane domain-containing protein n=1 Tax=Pelagibius sp. CAU 1746 TaxID=3140370 RepID=UPI00325A68C8
MPATAETADQPLPGRAPVAARRGQGHWAGRYGALAVKLLVSLGLLALLARAVDLPAVGALLLDLPLWAGLAATAALAGVPLVSALRWWLVLRALGTPLPLRRVVALMFVGTFFTQVLPTSVGGDAVRIWQASRAGVPFNRAFGSVMLERITGLLALVIMVAGGVAWLGDSLGPPALRWLLLACLPGLLVGLALLCLLDRLPAGLDRRLRALPLLGHVLSLLDVMAAGGRRVLLAQPLSLVLLLLSGLAQLCSVLAALALAQGFGLDLGLTEALAAVPAIILIMFIPLSFAGWGVREGASVIMFGAVGIGADHALAISVLFGLSMLVAVLPGCALWLKGGRGLPPARTAP